MLSYPIPTPIYHLTHGKNLLSIITSGGLQSFRTLHNTAISHTNIAYHHIQDRRATKLVNCGPGGNLHDYIPFYFCTKSPMLYTISQGNVPGYAEGASTPRDRQRGIIYLVSSAQLVREKTLPFVFTDGHAVMNYSAQFDDLSHLNQIDWDTIHSQYWYDTPQDGDRKRRRQAEFLLHRFVPWDIITEIGVYDNAIKSRVESLISHAPHQPIVRTIPSWYY